MTAEGFDAHQAGDLASARASYLHALEVDPRYPDAQYLLGTLEAAAGHPIEALRRFDVAIEGDDDRASYHYSRGEALRALGRLNDALTAFRRALAIDDTDADWWNELGLTFEAAGQQQSAIASYEAALARRSAFAPAAINLANARVQSGDIGAAAALLHLALEFKPDDPRALTGMSQCLLSRGNVPAGIDAARSAVGYAPDAPYARLQLALALAAGDQLDAAETEAHEGVALAPQLAQAHFVLGGILRRRGFNDEADVALARAIELQPDYGDALLERAELLFRTGRAAIAVELLTPLVEREPDRAAAHLALAISHAQLDNTAAAETHYRKVIELDRTAPIANVLLSSLMYAQSRVSEAERTARAAIASAPDNAAAWINLALALQAQGQVSDAVSANRRALALDPGSALARSNLLFGMNYLDGVTPETLLEEHKAYGASVAPAPDSIPNFAGHDRVGSRKLRIGYVSPDFRDHVVGYFAEPVLVHHDRREIESVCYYTHTTVDHFTHRLRTRSDLWRDLGGASVDEMVRVMRADGLDIVVDLAGHTAHNALPALAQRVAPVQITWLGYPNTTGLSEMDWRVTDARADPPGFEAHHTERLLRLPEIFLCYDPPGDAPEIVDPLSFGGAPVTFGVFNNFPKITDRMLTLWAEILDRTPGASLLVKTASLRDAGVEERLRDRMSRAGLDARRVRLAGFTVGYGNHLAAVGSVDVALDTFPYHGTSTTCDSLWMGVPVVTLAGDRHAARVSVSILGHLGLDQLVATSAEEYVSIACRLAEDRDELLALRRSMRARMLGTTITDLPAFTRSLEAAYRTAWRDWVSR